MNDLKISLMPSQVNEKDKDCLMDKQPWGFSVIKGDNTVEELRQSKEEIHRRKIETRLAMGQDVKNKIRYSTIPFCLVCNNRHPKVQWKRDFPHAELHAASNGLFPIEPPLWWYIWYFPQGRAKWSEHYPWAYICIESRRGGIPPTSSYTEDSQAWDLGHIVGVMFKRTALAPRLQTFYNSSVDRYLSSKNITYVKNSLFVNSCTNTTFWFSLHYAYFQSDQTHEKFCARPTPYISQVGNEDENSCRCYSRPNVVTSNNNIHCKPHDILLIHNYKPPVWISHIRQSLNLQYLISLSTSFPRFRRGQELITT